MTAWFAIQKTVLRLILPPAGLLVLIVAGLILIRRGRRTAGRALTASGILLLYLLSLSPVASLLLRPLETEYPPLEDARPVAADAIVVLTAGVVAPPIAGLAPQPSAGSLARLAKGVALHRRHGALPLVICGGSGDPARPEMSEGAALLRTAQSLGVPEHALLLEDDSSNTREGAANVRRMLAPRGDRIMLVTSAFHMGRAARFFTQAGFEVIPAPTDYGAERIPFSFSALIPTAGSLFASASALYEYLSRARYAVF